MKFIVDCMLGKLAKWLKILGFDVLYFSKIGDDELIQMARKEGRILLTRDNGLVEKSKNFTSIFIQSENWTSQVRQVLNAFHLQDQINPHSRCLQCNQKLKPLSREKAKNLVTPFVYQKSDSFALCPDCGRVFWKGTHMSNMEKKIASILNSDKNNYSDS